MTMLRPAFGMALGLALVAALLPARSPGSAAGPKSNDWSRNAAARALSGHVGLPPLGARERARLTPDAVALGRKIFFDRRLSLNGTISCAMCHVPEQAFASNELSTAVGFEGRGVKRNAPSLLYVGHISVLFHDGRDTSLETQYIGPLVAPNEMANPSIGHVVDLLRRLPDYRGRFESAFGSEAGLDNIGAALAAYQRTLVAGSSRFDRWRFGGDDAALTAEEQRGFALFNGKAGCGQCHTPGGAAAGPHQTMFTDQAFHDTGYGWWREQLRQNPTATEPVEVAPGVHFHLGRDVVASVSAPQQADLGRYEVTLDPRDRWAFRTPSLRNVALTGPYMHDGGLRTLDEVIAFYASGGRPHPEQSPLLRPLRLDAGERAALVAFLGTLTSSGLDDLVREARTEPPDNW